MSANNSIVIMQVNNNSWSVWYNACVDNEFPQSAEELQTFDTLEEAVKYASEQDDTEYGISFKFLGKVPGGYYWHEGED